METKDKKAGYVYILTNPSFKDNWVKIGKSSRPVEARLKELDNTSVPLPFDLYATLQTKKYNEAEKLVHRYIERFSNLRIRDNREFFNVTPETALEIFQDVALMLDDARIEVAHKSEMIGEAGRGKKHPSTATPPRDEKRVWMIPCNNKYFDVKGSFNKYGTVYWSQYYNFQKGDTGYIYSSSPDSAIRFKFEVLEHDLPYSSDMDREIEFFVDPNDFKAPKEHNRFMLIKCTGETTSSRLSYANLIDNGMKMAPRGALNLTYKDYEDLLKYIQENF